MCSYECDDFVQNAVVPEAVRTVVAQLAASAYVPRVQAGLNLAAHADRAHRRHAPVPVRLMQLGQQQARG